MEISGLSAEAPVTLSDNEFKERLAAAIPHLRAFGRSLCGNRDTADDLVPGDDAEGMGRSRAFRGGYQLQGLDIHNPAQPLFLAGPPSPFRRRMG